ncbi:MAG: sensor domain-containing diguanylate cyclase [Firmicutes bacterium]|nr:sensor domain-containing diguanylate cyclase [Bacillota bacterium]
MPAPRNRFTKSGQFSQLAEVVSCAVMVLDENLRLKFANPSARRLFSVDDQSIGRGLGECIGCLGLDEERGGEESCGDCELADAVREVLADRGPLKGKSLELRIVKNGRETSLYTDVSIGLLVSKGERLAVVALNDITSLRQSEQFLQERNEQLEKLALIDPLTGVGNRRSLRERLRTEIVRLNRYGGKLAAVMLDLDDFKLINDRYGHLTGDRVLFELGALLTGNLRESDHVGRYGGEEFLLVLPHTDGNEGVRLAERLRSLLIRQEFGSGGVSAPRIKITASFGVTEIVPEDSVDSVFSRVDEALYTAKRAGKDCTRKIPAVEKGRTA